VIDTAQEKYFIRWSNKFMLFS